MTKEAAGRLSVVDPVERTATFVPFKIEKPLKDKSQCSGCSSVSPSVLLFKESKSLSPFMVLLQQGVTYNHQLFVSVSCFLFDSLIFPNLISLLGF